MTAPASRVAQLCTALITVTLSGCGRTRPVPPLRSEVRALEVVTDGGAVRSDAAAARDADARDVMTLDAKAAVVAPASLDAARSVASVAWVPFAPGRSSFVVKPDSTGTSPRLLAMLHGVCTPPSYVCGAWKEAAHDHGLLVCPTGNATCGPDGTGAPTWEEPFSAMDADLEAAIGAVRRRREIAVSREGEVLLGFSRGAYVAVILAVRHPGRWPFLILNEADVELTVPMLRGAGVHAVALIAGEWGTQIAGERKTVESLALAGYPARLWVMPRVGHAYSPDIDRIMSEALDFVLAHERDAGSERPLH